VQVWSFKNSRPTATHDDHKLEKMYRAVLFWESKCVDPERTLQTVTYRLATGAHMATEAGGNKDAKGNKGADDNKSANGNKGRWQQGER
jgi:hypothetical protein